MNEGDWTQIVAALIGGLLAAGTGAWLQGRQEKLRLARLRDLLTLAILDDLTTSPPLYEKLSDEWRKSKTIFFHTTGELTASRQTVINTKDYALLIGDAQLRRDLSRYYTRSGQVLTMLETFQRRKYDLGSKFHELLRDVRLRDPTLDFHSAEARTHDLMAAEDVEFKTLDTEIDKEVREADKCATTAKELHGRVRVTEARSLLNRLKM